MCTGSGDGIGVDVAWLASGVVGEVVLWVLRVVGDELYVVVKVREGLRNALALGVGGVDLSAVGHLHQGLEVPASRLHLHGGVGSLGGVGNLDGVGGFDVLFRGRVAPLLAAHDTSD